MSAIEEIQKDLNKSKARISRIDIEIAVLQKERELMSEKVWELGFYIEKIAENETQE